MPVWLLSALCLVCGEGRVMTLHQLRIFESVARHLNVTKASQELHMSQPAVSQQLSSWTKSAMRVSL